MSASLRWTSRDLELMPEDGKRREIIDGKLYVSTQPSWEHQLICVSIAAVLSEWGVRTGAGTANAAPGVIFADDDDVAPDVVWVSRERLPALLAADRHLHGAPDLIVEVLSPGKRNSERDREAKQKLYSRRGVREYWIVDWQRRQIEVYRRREAALHLIATLHAEDVMESPLLPGFSAPLERFFAGLPTGEGA